MLAYGAAQGGVRAVIERGRGVVKHQYGGICRKRSGDEQALLLSAGEIGAVYCRPVHKPVVISRDEFTCHGVVERV